MTRRLVSGVVVGALAAAFAGSLAAQPVDPRGYMATIVAKYGYLGDAGDCVGWPATGWIESPGELLAWIA